MIDMQVAGAVGDGVTDDSAAIQAAINANPDGTVFYFPAGVYLHTNIAVTGRSGLTFQGNGLASLLLAKEASTRMFTFSQVADITIQDLAFDNRHVSSYGGVAFYNSLRTLIQRTNFTDSNSRPNLGTTDRYSFVFGIGTVPHEDIQILDNTISNLQLEVDYAKRVQIRRNTITHSINTAGIGSFTLKGQGAVIEDFEITDNTLTDCYGTAIGVHLDPATTSNGSIQRINILRNTIYRTTVIGRDINIGTTNTSVTTTGNVFADIRVEHNTVISKFLYPTTGAALASIRFAARLPNFTFNRVVIANNIFIGTGTITTGFELTGLDNSKVYSNTCRSALAIGISLGQPYKTHVYENIVFPNQYGYRVTGSRGYNILTRNSISGPATIKGVDYLSAGFLDQNDFPLPWDLYVQAIRG